MKCPVCNHEQVEMMRGCAITRAFQPDETVERMWCCEACDSGGTVGYVQDLSSTQINVNRGVKVAT